jgi:hypothetical protein
MSELRMDYREREAIRQIEGFLRRDPGAKVFLVYGEAHAFPEPLWREVFGAKLPKVSLLRWSTPVSAAWDLEGLTRPGERLAWIHNAPAFVMSAVAHARNREELFAMLPKLRAEPMRDGSPSAARERLIRMLDALEFLTAPGDHLRVSEWLWRSYASGEGPFAGYRFPAGWLEDFRRLPAREQAAVLSEMTEPYLQREALRAMRRLPMENYPDLMMPEARLDALDKLEIPSVLTAEEVKVFLDAANLLTVDMGDKLAAKVQRRWGARRPPAAIR